MIKVRNAKPDDAIAINKVFFDAWLATYPNKEIGATEADIREIYRIPLSTQGVIELSNKILTLPPNKKIIVAEVDGKIVGVCRIFVKDKTNQLHAIYVLPEYQKIGVGKKMWEESLNFFDKTKKITVSVANYNHNAINFYKSLGFVQVNEYAKPTNFVMPISGVHIEEIEMEIKNNLL